MIILDACCTMQAVPAGTNQLVPIFQGQPGEVHKPNQYFHQQEQVLLDTFRIYATIDLQQVNTDSLSNKRISW